MTDHTSLVPIITAPPPPGYTLRQYAPLAGIADLLTAPATVTLQRTLWRGGQAERVANEQVELGPGIPADPDAGVFILEDVISRDAWLDSTDLPFLETLIHVSEGDAFTSMYCPGFYTVFDSDTYKTFYSDSALKYANYVVITQVREFANWVEGYPASTVDPDNDIDQSVLFINPHNRPALVSVEFVGTDYTVRVRVDAHSTHRLDFAATLGDDRVPWSGQVFVWGPNRVNMFFISHAFTDPCSVTTVEHSEVFRGDAAYEPSLNRVLRGIETLRRRRAQASGG